MAYVLEDEDEEEKAAGPMGGGGLGGPTGARSFTPPSAGATAGAARPAGTGFVSWDQILSANRDSATAAAQRMAGKIDAKGQGVQARLGEAQKKFDDGVNRGNSAAVAPTQVSQTPSSGRDTTTNAFGQPTSTPAPASGGGRSSTPTPAAMPQSSAPTPAAPLPETPYTYTGPNALSDDSGWAGILKDAGDTSSSANLTSDRDEMGNLRGNAGLETLLREDASGNYTAGQSRLDADLLGATGRQDFDALQSKYAGLPQQLSNAEDASRLTSGKAKGRVDEANAEVERVRKERKALLDAQVAERNKDIDAKKAAVDQARRKLGVGPDRFGKEEFDAYNELQHENLVRDATNFVDPTFWAKQLGVMDDSINDKLTDGWEKLGKDQLGMKNDSRKVRTHMLSPQAQAEWKIVYSDLTPEELYNVARMSALKQNEFINARFKQIMES